MPAVPHDEPEDARPWEAPGAVRRDCEPHRGTFLLALAIVSSAVAVLSLITVAPALLSLPLGAWVRAGARRDLGQMRAGFMDPAGVRAKCRAEYFASGAVRLSVGALGGGALLLLTRLLFLWRS